MKRIYACASASLGIGAVAYWVRGLRAEDKIFRDLLHELTVGPNPEAILHRVAERAVRLVDGVAAYVERVEPVRDELVVAAVQKGHGLPELGMRGPYHGSVAEQAIVAGHAVIIRDVGQSRSILASLKQPVVVLPLVSEGKALGALVVIEGRKAFSPRIVSQLQTMPDTAAVSLRRAITLEELCRSVRTREELLRILAHDLRNPLNTIAMAATALRNPSTFEKAGANLLQMIERSSSRMNRLIQDLLDNAIIEQSGKLPMSPQTHPVHRLAEEVCALTEIHAKTKTVQVECNIEGNASVYADRDRLLQVLINLIDNAIKFTPEGGKVTVKSRVLPTEVVFSVSDTGPGISEENRERIFEAYWQAPATAHLGAGLGLSIAKRIVEQHGGRIWVESVLGQGSTFLFSLPAAAN